MRGHYRNQRQAFSNPSKWPQIDIRITTPQRTTIEVKSWYKYKGEEDPYNHIRYEWEHVDEKIIYSKTYNLIHDHSSCPFIWTWDGEWWRGHPDGECIQESTEIITNIRFNGIDYRVKDVGYDVETGRQVYGKDPSEGEFFFTMLDK